MKNQQPHWLSLDRDALRAWQMLRLRQYLGRVVGPFSAHYRELFAERGIRAGRLRNFSSLEGIPFSQRRICSKGRGSSC